MATPVTMPQLGESVTEGTILRWIKAEGEEVGKDEPLCEVETDKVTAELPSPFAGRVERFLVPEGTTVDVGVEIALLAAVGSLGEEPETPVTEEFPSAGTEAQPTARNGSPGGRRNATVGSVPGGKGSSSSESAAALRQRRSSPVVRRLAAEHGVEIAEVPGTGCDGRVTRKDIEAYVESLPEQPVSEPPATAPLPGEPNAPETHHDAAGREPVEVHERDAVIEVTGTRRAIASRMSLSKREAPHAWTMVEADVSGLVALRETEKEAFRRREGLKLTYLPFVVRAVVEGLREHPVLNSVWDGDRIVLRGEVNVGVAVDLEDALVVPVIRRADSLSLIGLARETDDRVRRAREGRLTPEDVSGGTFTVNNSGSLGSVVSTPIINYPQAAILSAEAVVKRPVVVDDAIAVRSMMNLEVSFDHRILDGGAALRFLNAVKGRLEKLALEDGLR
ncbi:MAG: 2-oxo acid dehydrogenase subunit E2 [Rubrobacter sp.]|nr:2-oxo acid dehydrogenase subunit E2 [Rubrobacter sp.]